MLKNKRGFTLIELAIVIVILGILAAVAIPRYADIVTEARKAAIDAGLNTLRSAWAIEFAKDKREPTVTEVATAVEGGVAHYPSFITISGIFRSEPGRTDELYRYRTFRDSACNVPTTGTGDVVKCIRL